MSKRKLIAKCRLIYPKHIFAPDDLLNFIELKGFTRTWDDLNLPDEDLGALQISIMCHPKGHPVIEGTDGLRKMRFATSQGRTGKSGGLRVCYVYFERFYTVLLVLVYPKNVADNLPEAAKKRINQAIQRIERELENCFAVEED